MDALKPRELTLIAVAALAITTLGLLNLQRRSLVPYIAQGALASGPNCQPAPADWLSRINSNENKVHSQNGEDGIISFIFFMIGTTNRYFVEFGTEDGMECNTRLLREQGWQGLLMDGGYENLTINLRKEFISPSNIIELFAKYSVPHEMDLLSIDVNFDDWFVWKAISSRYRPRVLIMEYNSMIPVDQSWTVNPSDTQRWPTASGGSSYFGASLRALYDLGRLKGYSLVACDTNGVNAFFVRDDILQCQGLAAPPVEQLYVGKAPFFQPETNASREWLVLNERGEVMERLSAAHVLQDPV